MDDYVNWSTPLAGRLSSSGRRRVVPEESTLKSELAGECAELVRRMRGASRVEDVEAAFAFFLGSFAFANLRAVCDEAPVVARRLKLAVREALACLYECSGLWRHCMERPFGYPGDYSVLEHVYDVATHPRSIGQVGSLLDRWSLTTTLPEAVRGRKDLLRLYLEELAGRMRETDRVAQVLSIASGGAREVIELPARAYPNLVLTLLDHDSRPLEHAERQLARLSGLKVRTLKADALASETASEKVAGDRRYDVIYSFGLFDYLPDDDLLACLRNFKPLLKPDGCFVFCLKDGRFYDPLFYDLFLDWRFVSRTEDAGAMLAEKAGLQVSGQASVKGRVVHIYFCQPRSRA